MPRTCTVCVHAEREAIDRALISALPFRHIASQWDVSTAALQRHKGACLPATLALAKDAEEAANADDLLAQLRSLQERTLRILNMAEGTGKLGTAVMAIREARGNLELLAELTAQLDRRPVLNLWLSAEWAQVRAVLFQVLRDYPDVRATVAGRLLELETG